MHDENQPAKCYELKDGVLVPEKQFGYDIIGGRPNYGRSAYYQRPPSLGTLLHYRFRADFTHDLATGLRHPCYGSLLFVAKQPT